MGLAAAAKPGRAGRVALGVAALGILAVAVSYALGLWYRFDVSWLLLITGLVTHGAGLFVFGLVGLFTGRRTLLALWPLLFSVVGSFGPLLVGSTNYNSDWPNILFGAGLGGGWLVQGLLMLRAARARPAPTAMPPQPASA
jgi:hypothetical protein